MQFEPWEILAQKEKEERHKADPSALCTFGIKALDDAMFKIFPDDLIVIGADSGAGKSSLVIDIAGYNAAQGKRVALFFLEGGHNEAIRRVKWQMICAEYYREMKYKKIDMSYVKWRANDMSMDYLKDIEDIVDKQLAEKFKENFFIYDISPDFINDNNRVGYGQIYQGLMDFFDGTEFGRIKYNLDLLLIDHLHYFDLEDGTKSTEAEKLTKAMRTCKEISDIYKIPIILVSHLRKKGKDRGLPDQEDFHGSSNIPKIATDCITISPAFDMQDNGKLIYPTFFRFTKSRRGLKSNYAALLTFDFKQDCYLDDYTIYPVSHLGLVKKEEIPEDKMPHWYKYKDKKEEQQEWEE